MEMTGEDKYWEKNMSQCHFVHHKSQLDWFLGWKWDYCSSRPALPDVTNEQNRKNSEQAANMIIMKKHCDSVKFRGTKQAQNVGQKCYKITGPVQVRIELRLMEITATRTPYGRYRVQGMWVSTLWGLKHRKLIVTLNSHRISITRTNQLTLYREIIVVCSQIHTKHI